VTSISWLHMSDLHARPTDRAEQRRLWREVARDVAAYVAATDTTEIEPPGFLFFTGDIAQQGNAQDYAVAREAFKVLSDAARLSPARIFMVPGNHDIDRAALPLNDQENARLRMAAYRADELRQSVDEFWDSTALQQLESKLEPYLEFASHYAPVRWGPLGSWTSQVEAEGVACNLVGLNSVWNGGSDELDAPGVPLVGDMQREQVEAALVATDGALNLVLQHHPTEYLNVLDSLLHEDWLGCLDALVFAGHVHQSKTAERRSVDGRHVQFIGGPLYSGYEAAARRYSLGTLRLEPTRRQLDLHLRKYASHGRFVQDGERYRAAPDGHISFSLHERQRILGDPNARETPEPVGAFRVLSDFVSLRYDEGAYALLFKKRYRNDSATAWTRVYARIVVNAFPDDRDAAKLYHRAHPLDLEQIDFKAFCGGHEIKWELVHDQDANKEIMLVLEGENMIYPGHEREVSYTCCVADAFCKRSVPSRGQARRGAGSPRACARSRSMR